MKYLTPDEWKRFIGVVESPRDRAMFVTMYWRGLRASEARLLTRADIDLERGQITTHRLKRSNTGGVYDMAKEEREALTLWLADPACEEHPFPIARGQVFVLCKRYATLAGLPGDKRHPHMLKHSIATHLLDKGLDLTDVQDWLGHKSISSTVMYAAVTNKRRRAAARKAYK